MLSLASTSLILELSTTSYNLKYACHATYFVTVFIQHEELLSEMERAEDQLQVSTNLTE